MNRFTKSLSGLTFALLANAGVAADMPHSGFFDDYGKLQAVDASWISSLYTSDQLHHLDLVIGGNQVFHHRFPLAVAEDNLAGGPTKCAQMP